LGTNEVRYREAETRLWESVGVTPVERRVHLHRVDQTVRIQEVGEGPPILFVHGASNAGASWASLVARLAGFRCVLLDRPGCGLSDPLRTGFDDVGRLGAFADDLAIDVLDALGLETAHLVGTSFGGYMVLRAAAAHPDRIDRLVTFGWSVGAPVIHTPMVMRLSSARWIGRLGAKVPPSERAVRMILRQIGLGHALDSGGFSQVAIDWFRSLLRDTNTMANEISAGPRIMTPRRGLNESILLPPSVLSSVKAPAFFLWGEDDPMGGIDVAKKFVDQFPDATLELLPNAGHAVWMDDADHVAASLTAFLRP
jgi:pimeloyl-ACP methyl ester carboxylesterase